jgi:two-component system NtrC family response regulator
MSRSTTVLVVEDDGAQRDMLAGFLEHAQVPGGLAVQTAADASEARAALAAGAVDVVVTDVRMPGDDGLDLLAWTRTHHPLVDVIVVTAYGSVEIAVEAMRRGAHDFLTKPVDLDVLEQRLARLAERRALEGEVRRLRDQLDARLGADGVVAESAAMQDVLRVCRKMAPTDATVLVTGESGTGKEVVAGLLQAWSRRADGPFLRINCGALPESLLESELFGHVRGAFTGAESDRPGLFREADGGTLFLDEIGEVSPAVQVRLLRVLQEREVRPVGGTRTVRTDVRVVAATNRDLAQDVEDGRFRRDLLYRLNALTVHVPPLRERPEDLTALVPLLLRRTARDIGSAPPRLSRAAHDALLAHPFPGNVRELQNVIERAVILCDGAEIRLEDLPRELREPVPAAESAPDPTAGGRSLPEVVAAIERRALARAMAQHGGVKARAARELGIPERVLRYKLRTYGMDPTKTSGSRRDRRSGGAA